MSEPSPARSLTAEIKSEIRGALDALRKAVPGFRSRQAQLRMIAEAAGALATPKGAAVVEAPTGTGKSLAYLTAGVPIALAQGLKLVISTGTVALQEQLFERDIPRFLAATKLPVRVVLAKGRQRYACLRNMVNLCDGSGAGELDFCDGTPSDTGAWARPPRAGEADLVERLLKACDDDSWDGDIDRPPTPISEDLVPLITTSASTCSNRRCAFFDRCPGLIARKQIEMAHVVVTNHAMVMADLVLSSEDGEGSGGVILPAPEESLYVFDEGHRLPGFVLDAGAGAVHMPSTRKRLEKLRRMVPQVYRSLDSTTAAGLGPEEGNALLDQILEELGAVGSTVSAEWAPAPDDEFPQWLAPGGELPEHWQKMARSLADKVTIACRWIEILRARVLRAKDLPQAVGDSLAKELGLALENLRVQCTVWQGWASTPSAGAAPAAKWLSVNGRRDLICHASPVTAGPLLTRVLWQQAASVLITSATINAGDNFRGFTREVALPETGIALALPSPFDYATQAELLVPALGVPHTLRDEHARAIANWMEQRLDWDAGNLVLFTSRAKMRIAMESLPAHLRDRCRVQGDKAKVLLVDEHMDEIRAGRGSTLVGLASFGEGLDLPGDACTTVVVTQLPFTVPTDPVSATLSAWFEAKGRNPFIEISVPEATRTLVQYCGRLIRSENDRGRVVILDRRLVEKRYGNGMLQALPPFRRSVERAA